MQERAIPPQTNSRQVVFRVLFRFVVLTAFATLGSQGFGETSATLLALTAVFCAITAAMRREAIFGRALTHWDEAAVYAVVGHVVWTLI